MERPQLGFATRPTLRGRGGAVVAGERQAAEIGRRILAAGGNAADAACAVGFALQVSEPTVNSMGGEVAILVWDARAERAYAISGQGPAPAAATLAYFRSEGIDEIVYNGFLPATVPASLDAWCLLLERFGTLRLEEVLAPARDLAHRGVVVDEWLHSNLRSARRLIRDWPSSRAVYRRLPAPGRRLRIRPLSAFFDGLIRAERAAPGGREAGIRAARDSFYRGRDAERIEAFLATPIADATGAEHAGLLRAADLAAYQGRVEDAPGIDYRGARVWKCPPWTQGPVLLQQLAMLEPFDLAAAGRRSPETLHLQLEAAKLALADREGCYADPVFEEVPLEQLLSRPYAEQRRALIDPERASPELRPGMGRLPSGWPVLRERAGAMLAERTEPLRRDTTHCSVMDAAGNCVSATPSGGFLAASPIVPGLAFPVGTRLQMFNLDPEHPNHLAPGKRPRTTLSPSLARLSDGRMAAFGTPGGDYQDQWLLQLLMDLEDFGVEDLQDAVDAPRVHSLHAPSSFYPHHCEPGWVAYEPGFEEAPRVGLALRGHRLRETSRRGRPRLMVVTRNARTREVEAGGSPGRTHACVLP